ncbi:soluble lytic murein transglycosylase-like protein [Silvimonas terrae]|uniref:Soluble lytic murein transglycosylase-like protein n=1 Tax=Silvimonas terrae TaxID=300266 RepID=A0A840RCM2_9NEIS|nr:transglycosylase SLT domain-containing protein [Silvimonas terrae]MBB5190707.1 soluble lytic murein transglycosylase-like protein [Silvimonas terrae]
MAINTTRLAVLAAAGLGIWWVLQIRTQSAGESQDENGFFIPDVFGFIKTGLTSVGNAISDMTDMANSDFKTSLTQGRGNQYASALEAINSKYGMPPYLLSRIAYQESRFRDDIVSGKTKSSAGAAGMFQLMPMHWKYVDPYNWQAAGDYAAKNMLCVFYKQFGNSWVNAIAAYNGYPSVLKSWNKNGRVVLDELATQTQEYVASVIADLGWDY